jgi:hypothetical protein
MAVGPYDLPESFQEFALMPKFDENIDILAALAEPEDWDYHHSPSPEPKPILRNYVKCTYRRIAKEKKISVTKDEKHACWNTGLVTPHQEPIYILFEENKFLNRTVYWHFWKFARKGLRELTQFPVLPDMAHYYEDPTLLVYDIRRELRPNIEHIIADNRARFPAALQTMSDFALQNLLKGAIDAVIERVKRNYKTAVPQLYDSNVQLLLPLCLTDPSKADLALVVERFPEFYRAATCLPLDWAYNNARQLKQTCDFGFCASGLPASAKLPNLLALSMKHPLRH